MQIKLYKLLVLISLFFSRASLFSCEHPQLSLEWNSCENNLDIGMWHFTPDVSDYEPAQHTNEPFQDTRQDAFSDICHDTAYYAHQEIAQENHQNMDQTENYPFAQPDQTLTSEPVSAEPQFPLEKAKTNLEDTVHSFEGRNALKDRINQINRQQSGFHIFSNTELQKEATFINMALDGTITKLLNDIQKGDLQAADLAFQTLHKNWPYKHAYGYIVPREMSGSESRLIRLLGGKDIMQYAERCLISRPDYLKAHGDRFYRNIVSTKKAYETMQKQGKFSNLNAEKHTLHKSLKTKQGRTDLVKKVRLVLIEMILADPFTKSYAVIANEPLKQAKQTIRSLEQQIFTQFAKQGITDPVQINNMLPESPFHQDLITMQTLLEARTDFQKEVEVEQVTHLYPVDQLTQAVSENSDLLTVYQAHNFGNPSRIEIRVEKMEQIAQGTMILTHQQYELTADAIGLLYQEGLNPELYQECSGNQLQQHIHQECIDIVEQLALPNSDILIREYTSSMLHFVDAAREYNQANSPLEAMTVTDVCWSIFDCIKAAGEGVFQGTIGTVINHPIETVLCVCAPEYLLAYHVGKIAYAYLDVKITSFMDQEAGEQKLADYLKPLTDCIDIINDRDITLRGSIKLAATVTTQILIQGKLNTGLKTFYETTKKRAQNYLKTNPTATAEQYLATPDGMLLKASGGPGKNAPSLSNMGANNTKNPIKPLDYGHSAIQYQELKNALQAEEFTSVINVTEHGLTRLIERKFTPNEVVSLITKPDYLKIQADGAKAFIQKNADRYTIMVLNEITGEVITALKETSLKKIIRLGRNYGWEL